MDRINRRSRLTALLFIAWFAVTGAAQTSSFTYQGRLTDGGAAANGPYQMQFTLFPLAVGGDPISPPIQIDSVDVANGVFTVELNFTAPNAFNGGARWLEIAVKKPTDHLFSLLTPRQPLTSTPYALRTLAANSADTLSSACTLCVTDAHIQAVDGSKVTGTVTNATSADNVKGVVGIANGGTGSATQNFVDLSHDQIVLGKKTFLDQISGDGSGLTNMPGAINWQIVSGLSQQALPNTGYMAANNAQVTITLPPSPKVGDIVRISGMGPGGWKLVQNAGQFVVGGTNLDSPSAVWTPHLPSGPWQSIASSADGMKLVVCGTDGGTLASRIYTSTDFGETWMQSTIGTGVRCSDVASSDDGTKLITAANNQQIYTSNNFGESWEPHLSNGPWRGVASSASGTQLAAITTGAVYTSSDGGSSWNSPISFGSHLTSIASSALGDKLVAVGDQIYTSVDYGVNWTTHESIRFWRAVASSADGSKLVAVVDSGLIYASTDSGVTWTPRETSRSWRAVASSDDGSKLVATVLNGQIYVSTDFGHSWAPRAFTTEWEAVASSADGMRLVATVNVGQIYTSTQNTTLGTEGYLTGGQFTSLELQYIGNGKFLPLSHEGTILGH